MSNDNVIEFSPKDIEDLDTLDSVEVPEPSFHTVLEVWREVLKPAAAEATKRVTPAWASRIVAAFVGVTFADMEIFRDSYFGKLQQLYAILLDEIASDGDCLSYATVEEDATENGHHYKNLLLNWQLAVLQWELDWETTSGDAAVELAAISEVHKMFFSENGIVAYLDSINFEFTEADQAELHAALEELREGAA